jgi:hypothetical protein
MKIRKPIYRPVFVILLAAGMLAGCAVLSVDSHEEEDADQTRQVDPALADALLLYRRGDFEAARVRFKTASIQGINDETSRKARLGEICCDLMLAETKEEVAGALHAWHAWTGSAENPSIWDKTLIDPLVARLIKPKPVSLPASDPHPKAAPSRENPKTKASRPEIGEIQKRMEALEKQARRTEQLQRNLDQVQAENQTLREKIKALEAIDQNIRKKKTEIATPGEAINE